MSAASVLRFETPASRAIAEERAERLAVQRDAAVWRAVIAADPTWRSATGQPLPDAVYLRAHEIAERDGQAAATTYMAREQHALSMAAIERQNAIDLATYRAAGLSKAGPAQTLALALLTGACVAASFATVLAAVGMLVARAFMHA